MVDTEQNQLVPFDGSAVLVENFVVESEVDDCFRRLLKELRWQEERYTIYGKQVLAPRLVCWYGDKGAVYKYSGITHQPQPWHVLLQELKLRIEKYSSQEFNSVLGNLYRNGNDSMGWHADKEPELGDNPCVASLSLGEERLFKFRHNKSK